ncbi:MAG: 5'-nucleotidase [Prolixibacteraceae bacterium]
MSRFFILILSIFLFVSCSSHRFICETITENIPIVDKPGSVDSMVQSVLKPYRDSIEHDLSRFVTSGKTSMVKGKPESKLTNLMADIILNYAEEYCKSNNLGFKPDASYVNYGGIRASLPEGKITVGHIFELMPFENEIVLVKISGDSFRQMADRIAGRGGEGVSGTTIGIRGNKAGTINVGGKSLENEASYWLATNDYVASGGDQMSMFAGNSDIIYTHKKIRDVTIELLRKRYEKEGQLDVKEDGRIYHEQ